MFLKVGSESESFTTVNTGVLGIGGLSVVIQVALEPLLIGHQFEAHRTHPLPNLAPRLRVTHLLLSRGPCSTTEAHAPSFLPAYTRR